jgi:MFS family permease
VAIINYVGMMGTFFLISIFMQQALGFTPLRAGLFMLPSALTMGGTSVLTGKLSDKMNPKYLIVSGLILRVFSFYLFSTVNTLTPLGVILAIQLLRSFSAAWIMTPLSSSAMRTLPAELYRHGSGLLALTRGIGGSLGIAITTTYLSYRISWNASSSLQGVDGSSFSIIEAMMNINNFLTGVGENADFIATKSILLIARKLLEHAMLNGYQDTFIFLAVIFSLAIIPAMFIKVPVAGKRNNAAT